MFWRDFLKSFFSDCMAMIEGWGKTSPHPSPSNIHTLTLSTTVHLIWLSTEGLLVEPHSLSPLGQDHTIPNNIPQYPTIPHNILQYPTIPCNTAPHPVSSWTTEASTLGTPETPGEMLQHGTTVISYSQLCWGWSQKFGRHKNVAFKILVIRLC